MDNRAEGGVLPAAGRRAPRAPDCTMVIFGAGGDLTRRLLMPALYNLSRTGLLPDRFALIAHDRTPKTDADFREYLTEGIRNFVTDTGSADTFDGKAWDLVV